MYKIQKEIGKNNNGDSYITIPNIRSHQIMDKCVLSDLTSQISDDFKVLNRSIYNNNDNIEKIFTEISNTVTNITNAITEMNSVSKIKDYSNRTIYEENFINALNIDMTSSVDFDFNNNYCCLPSVTSEINTFADIYINDNYIKADDLTYNQFNNIITIKKDTVTNIKCSFNDEKYINNIKFDFQSSSNLSFEIYSLENDELFLIETGLTSSSIIVNFYPKKIKTIILKLYSVDDESTAYINNIYGFLKVYKNFSELKTKELKIYNGSKMKVVVNSNSNKNIKPYIGFINKNNQVIWNSGDTYSSFNLFNDYKKLINNSYQSFGSSVGNNFLISDLNANYNRSSVNVLSGYGMWHCTLIECAFMNEDLTMIEYGYNDIKSRTYIDVDECNFDVVAGQLFILDQQAICDKDIDIRIPKPECFAIGEEDKTSLFRYSILVNGEKINSSITITDYFDAKLLKGTNNIQIIVNLKKLKDDSEYSVKMFNYLNLKEYTDCIYHKNLIQSSVASLQTDILRDCFAITNNKIVVNNINANVDRFMVSYETIVDSDIHYIDHNGQYMKVLIIIKIFGDDSYNNIKINKVSLVN